MKHLLDLIAHHESGNDPNRIYSRIEVYDYPPKPLVEMTVQEVLDWQDSIDLRYPSEACGKFQFLEDTLRGLVKGAELKKLFDEEMQDRLAMKLLKRRGLGEAASGRITPVEFCINLSMEWASIPVVIDTDGHRRKVKKGQSFYSGDNLNKALIDPDHFLHVVKTDLGIEEPGAKTGVDDGPALAVKPMQPKKRSRVMIKEVQEQLKARGYPVGKVDGLMGPATKRAIRSFETDNDLFVDGLIDEEFLEALDDAPKMPIDPTRQFASSSELKGSKTLKQAGGQIAAGTGGVGIGALAIFEPYIPKTAYGIRDLADLMSEYGVYLLGGLFVVVAIVGVLQWNKRVDDHRSGKNMSR